MNSQNKFRYKKDEEKKVILQGLLDQDLTFKQIGVKLHMSKQAVALWLNKLDINPHRRQYRDFYLCPLCKKEFERSAVSANAPRFCSVECRRQASTIRWKWWNKTFPIIRTRLRYKIRGKENG